MRRASNGAERLCLALEAAGIECVFGVPGTQNVPLFDALRTSRLRTVVATHELAASFMANGYYRASGRLAALVTIPGPGFTYALTGIAEAQHDSAALLYIVGAPPHSGGPFAFQAVDQRRIASPLVKGAWTVTSAEEIGGCLAAAVELALGGEPGPVLLELSPEALTSVPSEPVRRPAAPAPPTPVDGETSAQLRAQLLAARRPLLLAGQGCAAAAALVQRLAEALPAPVLTTCSGRGTLPEDHPLSLGFDSPDCDLSHLNELLASSDLVLGLGCKLSSAGTGMFRLAIPKDSFVHVDASAEVLGAHYPARLCVAARVEEVLERLVAAVEADPARASSWTAAEVAGLQLRLRAVAGSGVPEPTVRGVSPANAATFFSVLREALPRDGILLTDSGLHQFLARRHWRVFAPRGLIVPSDYQSMGFAIPAAIGAALASPGRAVAAVVGDGGLAISAMELLTAARERIALTVIVFNDRRLNLIRVAQLARFGRTMGVDLRNPDFGRLAAALGVGFARVDGDAEVALRRAIDSRGVTLVEVLLDDSPAIGRLRRRGLARGAARRLLGRFGAPLRRRLRSA